MTARRPAGADRRAEIEHGLVPGPWAAVGHLVVGNGLDLARAKTATIILKSKEHSVVVEISDDGAGFEPERTRGVGILGMEERVRQLGGSFEIRSVPGKGTTVQAELPLTSGAAS